MSKQKTQTHSPSSSSNLHELIAEMQQLQASQEEETNRLRRRLSWLESRRREFFDLVSQNNSDMETRRKLDETEKQLDQIQSTLNQSEADLKKVLREIRQRILEMRNQELSRLEEETKLLRQRKETIHQEEMPEVMARLSALKEEETTIDQQIEELARRMRDLSTIDMPMINPPTNPPQ